MPRGKERALRRRINSVQSKKQITRAMELIAATRVVKAMTRANAARPYSTKMTGVIEDLAAGGVGIDDPLLRSSETVSSIGFVVITSDRGLAGAYNSSVIRAAEREIMAAQTEGKDYKLFAESGQIVVSSDLTSLISDGDEIEISYTFFPLWDSQKLNLE